MTLNQTLLTFFYDYTDMVAYNKSTGATAQKYKLYDRTSPGKTQYVEITSDGTNLTISQNNDLPTGYNSTQYFPYNFDNGMPSSNTAYDIALSNEASPSIVIGVGDVRDLANSAHWHKYKLSNGIVLQGVGQNNIRVYYKNTSDKSVILI